MSTLKCKMCGGTLTYEEGKTVVECEYCGSLNTIPNIGDEKRLQLFDRANRLRSNCDFDKAYGVYEAVVAEYPDEAEAYWGLILCKYGIEYVDDPATGRKVPTCHRSSFDGVFDDSNFDMVMEYCDAASRSVYRDEAKQIEEIRKGIVEISSKEEPYDIFICYKETDENGDRTIDSTIAQDVYDELTSRKYKVFFSRITLEDKLGQEYEPYIFAALNSAKVMLVFGTSYDNFNAVWVKNEWTRFLKLMENNKGKYLIPCFKDIDAYDMPKEFNKLQAQDMGKVGAIQDLVRGIKKILGDRVQEVAVNVRSAGTSALLQRGQIALEDGDWDKADLFFEEVLNTDAKCAEAYWGKFLASRKASSTQKFFDSVIAASESAEYEDFQACEPERKHIKQMADEYQVEGYLSAKEITDKYSFDRTYMSAVDYREKQKEEILGSITGDKLYNRVKQYGKIPGVEEGFANLERLLDSRINEAIEEAGINKQDVIDRYGAFIASTDEAIVVENRRCIKRRDVLLEEIYNEAQGLASGGGVSNYRAAIEKYKSIKDYKDSAEQIESCQKRIREILAAESKAKKKKIVIVVSVVAAVAVIIAGIIITVKVIIPNSKYNKAMELYNAGNYSEAAESFAAMDGYKDSADYVNKSKYAIAKAAYDAGDYDGAIQGFTALGEYSDSANMILQCKYDIAKASFDSGKYEDAISGFTELAGFSDSDDMVKKSKFAIAKSEYDSKDYDKAIEGFAELGSYNDADQMVLQCKYDAAKAAYSEKKYVEAAALFEGIIEYEDSQDMLLLCKYEMAMQLYNEGSCAEAMDAFVGLGDYNDSKQMIEKCLSGIKVGDTITYGNYEGHTRWCVIDKKESKALLISEDIVETRIFNKRTYEDDDNKWVKSDIRKWLNKTYINKAFNKKENSRILSVEGDKVFLLSVNEYRKYKDKMPNVNRHWWLRSPGEISDNATFVYNAVGGFDEFGELCDSDLGVRPAMWINLGS